MALHPDLLKGTGNDFVYVVYTYVDEAKGPDPTVADPVTTAALSPVQADRIRRQDAALSDLARTAGLFYFFSGRCPLCEVQSPIVAAFAEAYGFRVIAISLDGAPDPVFVKQGRT